MAKRKGVFQKWPRKVRVGKRIYPVIVKKLPSGYEGWVTDTSKIIYISDHLDEEARASVLIHELLHAIDWEKKLNLSEKTVLKLESGIIEVFKKNGWKINW